MIIQLRGTHGSGKSTVVKRVFESSIVTSSEEIYVDGRNRPIGYNLVLIQGRLFIPGSYANACGGCDTIPKVEEVFRVVREYAEKGYHVLFEGILAQHSAPRLLEIAKDFQTTAVILTTSDKDCIESVRQRRVERGDERELNPANLLREMRSVESAGRRLQRDGLKVLHLGREEAYQFCLKELS